MQAVEIRNRDSGVAIRDSAIASQSRNSKTEKPVLSEAKDRQSAIRETVRVLMVAGGTGGHIYPALAVAEELRRRSANDGGIEFQIEFLGTKRSLENRVIPSAGFVLHAVEAQGLKGIRGWRRIQNFMALPRSAIESGMVLRKFQPQVVVGAGGYVAGPAMLEAALQDIPTLLIEPNAQSGFTSRAIAPLVRVVAAGFAETAVFFGDKAHLTGCPVRPVFHTLPPKEHRPPWTLLVMGGSQGSHAINECVARVYPALARKFEGLKLIHQTGEKDYAVMCAAYASALKSEGLQAGVDVRAFIDDVPAAMSEADLVLSRAGAVTVTEIAVAGKAAIFVPFPQAADQHQLANARALERVGGARIVEQRDLTPERLADEVAGLLADPAALRGMEQRAHQMARPDAAARIADLVEKLAGLRPGGKKRDEYAR